MKEFFSGFKQGFKEFGENITIIVNAFLLFFVYFFGVLLSSFVGKISKKEFLDLNLEEKTYYDNLDLGKEKLENYYRQF